MKTEIGLSNPFNYTGSKHRYLKDISEVLPEGEKLTVCDPFVGGGDLCSHLPKSWRVDASDLSKPMINMHKLIQTGSLHNTSVNKLVKRHNLSRISEAEYYKLRDKFNSAPHMNTMILYILICHSNTNRIRFSKKSGFNVGFGNRTFNIEMQKKLTNYIKRLKERKITFNCKDFRSVDFSLYELSLIDFPYLNTNAVYNENNGWNEIDQLDTLNKIDKEANKFICFGQIFSKGIYNKDLDVWSKRYNVKILKDTTASCSNNRKNEKTVEIMIWN